MIGDNGGMGDRFTGCFFEDSSSSSRGNDWFEINFNIMSNSQIQLECFPWACILAIQRHIRVFLTSKREAVTKKLFIKTFSGPSNN